MCFVCLYVCDKCEAVKEYHDAATRKHLTIPFGNTLTESDVFTLIVGQANRSRTISVCPIAAALCIGVEPQTCGLFTSAFLDSSSTCTTEPNRSIEKMKKKNEAEQCRDKHNNE